MKGLRVHRAPGADGVKRPRTCLGLTQQPAGAAHMKPVTLLISTHAEVTCPMWPQITGTVKEELKCSFLTAREALNETPPNYFS